MKLSCFTGATGILVKEWLAVDAIIMKKLILKSQDEKWYTRGRLRTTPWFPIYV
jgi:hypothetical protein